MLGSLFCGIQK